MANENHDHLCEDNAGPGLPPFMRLPDVYSKRRSVNVYIDCKSVEEEVKALEKTQAEQDEEIDALVEATSKNAEDIAGLKEADTTLHGQIDALVADQLDQNESLYKHSDRLADLEKAMNETVLPYIKEDSEGEEGQAASLKQLNAAILNLREHEAKTVTRVIAVEGRLDADETAITDIQTAIGQLKQVDDTLTARVNSNSTSITNVRNTANAVKADLEKHVAESADTFEDLTVRVNCIEGELASGVYVDSTVYLRDQKAQDEKITALEDSVDTLQQDWNDHSVRLSAVESTNEVQRIDIANNKAGVDSLEGRYTTMSSTLSSVRGDVLNLNHEVSVINDSIAELSGRVDEVEANALDFRVFNEYKTEHKAEYDAAMTRLTAVEERIPGISRFEEEQAAQNAQIQALQQGLDSDEIRLSRVEMNYLDKATQEAKNASLDASITSLTAEDERQWSYLSNVMNSLPATSRIAQQAADTAYANGERITAIEKEYVHKANYDTEQAAQDALIISLQNDVAEIDTVEATVAELGHALDNTKSDVTTIQDLVNPLRVTYMFNGVETTSLAPFNLVLGTRTLPDGSQEKLLFNDSFNTVKENVSENRSRIVDLQNAVAALEARVSALEGD